MHVFNILGSCHVYECIRSLMKHWYISAHFLSAQQEPVWRDLLGNSLVIGSTGEAYFKMQYIAGESAEVIRQEPCDPGLVVRGRLNGAGRQSSRQQP